MKKWLISIVLAMMFAVPFMVTAEPSYQVDVTNSPTADDNLDIGDTVFAVKRRQFQTAKFKHKSNMKNCGSCHNVKTVGVFGGGSIGIRSY